MDACGSTGSGAGRWKNGAGEEEKKKENEIKEKEGKEKRRKGGKGKRERVEGPIREKQKKEEGGCKMPGGGKTKLPGGNPRVWGLGGLGPGLGYSLAILKIILFLLQNNFRN